MAEQMYNADGEEMVRVEGSTYACKDELKKIGGVWCPAEKCWRVPKSQRFVAELLVNNSSTGKGYDITDEYDGTMRRIHNRRY